MGGFTWFIAALLLIAAASARADDQTILGRKLVVKNLLSIDRPNTFLGSAKELGSPNSLVGDPVANGGSLDLIVNGGTNYADHIVLPAEFWRPLGPGVGFKFEGEVAHLGIPPTKVTIKRTPSGTFTLKVKVLGPQALPPTPAGSGTDGGMILTLGGGDRYCAAFGGAAGGTITADTGIVFKILWPTVEVCPEPVL